MSTAKHTPGPWVFGYYGANGYCITTRGGTHLATSILYKADGGEANARLIAAAPELLECLENAAMNATGERRARYLAAIAKATGVTA